MLKKISTLLLNAINKIINPSHYESKITLAHHYDEHIPRVVSIKSVLARTKFKVKHNHETKSSILKNVSYV